MKNVKEAINVAIFVLSIGLIFGTGFAVSLCLIVKDKMIIALVNKDALK